MAGACDCYCHEPSKATKRGTLTRAVEQREQTRRVQDLARQEIERYYQQQKAFDAVSGNPLREDLRRRERESRERAAESNMLETLYQNERTKELTKIRSDEEEKLATALVKRAQETERKEKDLQRLREQSAEIRELEEKLRSARVNKERAQQLQEKAQIKEKEGEYHRSLLKHIEEVSAASAQKEEDNQKQRRDNNIKARQVLEEQMQDRADAVRMGELEHQRERAMVEEIMQRIRDEDMAGLAMKQQKQEETKLYIATFLAQQDDLRKEKRQADKDEERKIQEYWQNVREREALEAQRQAMRKEAADRIYEQLRKEQEAAMRAKDEEDQLINLLRQEEVEERRRMEEENNRRRIEEMREEIRRGNELQMRLKEERDQAMKAEEEDYRVKMMAKFAEDDRVEQMNAQKRRMKLQDHVREVQRLVDEKRRMYEEQKAKDEAETARRRAEEERKLAVLEEERKRLLREAAELRDYLPRGVLRDQADVDYINQVLAGKAK